MDRRSGRNRHGQPSGRRKRAPSSASHRRPAPKKNAAAYIAGGAFALAAIVGLIIAVGSGGSGQSGSDSPEPVALPEKPRPKEKARVGAPPRREPSPKKRPAPEQRDPDGAEEGDDERVALRKAVALARRQVGAALARDDLTAARSTLRDLGMELMELPEDDPLRRALAKLEAKVAAREKERAGARPTPRPRPRPDPRPDPGPPAARGPIDWNAEFSRFIGFLKAQNHRAIEAHARGLIRRAPKVYLPYTWLYEAQTRLDIFDVAYETAKKALALYPSAPANLKGQVREYYCYRSMVDALEQIGELEKALEMTNRIKSISGNDHNWWLAKTRLEYKLGNYEESVKAGEQAFRVCKANKSERALNALSWVGDAARALGDDRRAVAAFGALTRQRDPVWQDIGHVGLARAAALGPPGARPDLKTAGAHMRKVREKDLTMFITTHAMLLSLIGRHREAIVSYDRNRVSWRSRDAQADWFHGLSLLAVNQRGQAVERFTIAARRNRHYRKLLDTDPRVSPVAMAVKRRLGDFDRGKSVEERLEVAQEQVSTEVLLAQIRGFVRTFRFRSALADLRRLERRVQGSSRHDTQRQRERVERYGKLKALLIEGIRGGALKNYKLPLAGAKSVGARLSSADDTHYHLSLPNGGSAKGLWAQLSFQVLWQLFDRLKLSAAQHLTLADLAHDCDTDKLVERSLARAWLARGDRGAITGLISLRRGVPPPPGGYVLHDGRFVTAEEKRKYEQGLVLFRGRWMTKTERRHRQANHEKVGGKWVPLTAEQLRARGFVEYRGQWMTAQEVAARRGDWKEAWTERTAHYVIKTNLSKQFARKLAIAIEDAYQVYKRLFGAEPRGNEPMTLLAFRTYEDYRAYCERTGNMAQLNATGFAPSEPRTACGYDKLKSEHSLLQTMIHEGAHLFYQLAFDASRPGSWLAEGMATYFEGFKLTSAGRVQFHHRPKMRRTLFRQAMSRQGHIPLADFFGADAGKLINTNADKALVFYAQAWAVHYFFRKTPNQRYRQGFARYWELVGRGNKPSLLKLLGVSVAALEKDFLAFIKAQ